jgi:hypothetical protein
MELPSAPTKTVEENGVVPVFRREIARKDHAKISASSVHVPVNFISFY